jgi:uracil-DNA glycosylase
MVEGIRPLDVDNGDLRYGRFTQMLPDSSPPRSDPTASSLPERELTLANLQAEIRACRLCVEQGFITEANPVFRGRAGLRMMVVGQAPGERGHASSIPYAGASGKTLRAWLAMAGFDEEALYERFYLTSMTKCFPGPSATGKGDRAPSPAEIRLCSRHLDREIALVQPEIILALGRLSATALVGNLPLDQLVGTVREGERAGQRFLVLPLPHPSGVSHWLNAPANKERLREAMRLLGELRVGRGW